MSHHKTQWSINKYDLKTALELLNLPCLVKVADGSFGFTYSEENAVSCDCAIKFEKNICICFVRARVVDLSDVNWFIIKKGEEFVRSHARFAGWDILIPIEYEGKLRLYERGGGKQYFSIREVIQDFPRFVRVETDTICASPGVQTAQVVQRGTVLELDRVTKGIHAIRGSRETYLICKDNENSRELAFRFMAPVQFTRVADITKDCLKDFVEHLSLPQTVEFIATNPYDIISVDDDDARDLLVMLSGPLELLGLQMEHFVVGKVDGGERNFCDIIAVPAKDPVLETVFIHLPVDTESDRDGHRRGPSNGEYVDLAVTDDTVYDHVLHKLFLRYSDDDTPLVVRIPTTEESTYEVEEMPDTPPIPDRLDERALKHTDSAPSINVEYEMTRDKYVGRKKRCFSANDADERNNVQKQAVRESRGLRAYLSQLSKRMKSTASQILFGIEAFSGAVDQDLDYDSKLYSSKQPATHSSSNRDKRQGFVCYLDSFIQEHGAEASCGANEISITNSEHLVTLSDARHCVSDIADNVVYASVDVSKKLTRNPIVIHPCPVCRDISKFPVESGCFS